MRNIAIYGAGGLGKEVKVMIESINDHESTYQFIGFFDEVVRPQEWLGDLNTLNKWEGEIDIVIAIGDPIIRSKVVEVISNPLIHFATLIHPTAFVGKKQNVHIGEGSIIAAGVCLTTDIIVGDHVLINLNATIGHDVVIRDFCSIMPGANIAGGITINSKALIGSGANLINQVKIGEESRVGAGAVVTKNVLPYSTVVGVPAREL